MAEKTLQTLLRLRLLVGYLGERTQHTWWPTSFHDASSKLFLEPVFTKTSHLAQYHGVLEAARRVHDEHLSVGSYHLFRLPEEAEQDFSGMLQSSISDMIFSGSSPNLEAASTLLGQIASNDRATASGPIAAGPVAVGTINDLGSKAVVSAIASAYLSAFSRQVRVYPYLVR